MMISILVCLFITYSFVGWIYESFFCTVTSGKWENRGFLYGPVCPIYGTGAVAISMIMRAMESSGAAAEPWIIFVISVLGSVVLEFTTSWVLEKLFHAVWWDYSNLPFNVQGRISLFSSLGFGFAGLLVVYVIAPFTEEIIQDIPPAAAEVLALIFVFVFAVDLTLTVSALLDFDQAVIRMENAFNQNMDSIVDDAVSRTSKIRQDIAERRNLIDMQIRQVNESARAAIRRAKFLRTSDKKKESLRNQILNMIKSGRSGKGTE